MSLDEPLAVKSRLAERAGRVFIRIEFFAYLIVGLAFSVVAIFGLVGAGGALWGATTQFGDTTPLIIAIDRLLLVLMVVEILHTVRGSFQSGALTCEPFLVVGLIASIRRMLVITLESSQSREPGKWSADAQSLFNATLLELGVLAALILVMVLSIAALRMSER